MIDSLSIAVHAFVSRVNPILLQNSKTKFKHIKYQRRVKQTKVNILQERRTKILIKINLTRQETFILETGESSSLIEYPI